MKTQTTTLPQKIGETVMRIRQDRKIRQRDLAKNLGIPPSQLCKLEKGSSTPTLNTFIRIADELNISITELLSLCLQSDKKLVTETISQPLSLPSDGFTQITCTCDGVIDELPGKLLKKFIKMMAEYKRVEENCGVCRHATIPLNLPFNIREADAEALASRVRNLCGIGNAIVFDYVELLENNGFHIFIEELPPAIPGITFYDTVDDNFYTFISKHVNPEKQLFRLIYELGMVYLFTRNGHCPVTQTYEYKHFAKTFAANFLMPRVTMLSATAGFNLLPTQWFLELILRLKIRFSVSAEAFTIRLMELEVLDKNLGHDILAQITTFYQNNHYNEPGDSRISRLANSRLEDLEMILSAKAPTNE